MESLHALEQFELLSKHADDVQLVCLERILKENGKAEYLQKLGLDGRTDVASFKSCVPVVTHQDLTPYINRIINGDTSPVLTGKPIPRFSIRLVHSILISLLLIEFN